MPFEDPRMQDFVDALDPVNRSADRSPGFIWRLDSDLCQDGELEKFEAAGWLVNMSMWRDMEALQKFISSPGHLAVMRRRAEWFSKWPEATTVLWWVEAGHIPTFSEALARLERLRKDGPTDQAFSFGQAFGPPAGMRRRA